MQFQNSTNHTNTLQSKSISKVSVFLGMSEQFANLCQNECDHVELARFTHSPTAAYLFNFIDHLIFWRCVNLSNLRLYHNEYGPKVQTIACNNVQCTHDVNVLVGCVFLRANDWNRKFLPFARLWTVVISIVFFLFICLFLFRYILFSAKRLSFIWSFVPSFRFGKRDIA